VFGRDDEAASPVIDVLVYEEALDSLKECRATAIRKVLIKLMFTA